MHAARGGPSCRTGALWLAPIPPTKLHADGAVRRANHAHRAIDGCDRTSQTAGRLAIKRRTDTTCNTIRYLARVRTLPLRGRRSLRDHGGTRELLIAFYIPRHRSRTTIATIVPLLKVQGTIHTLTHSRSRCLASPGTSLASSLHTARQRLAKTRQSALASQRATTCCFNLTFGSSQNL